MREWDSVIRFWSQARQFQCFAHLPPSDIVFLLRIKENNCLNVGLCWLRTILQRAVKQDNWKNQGKWKQHFYSTESFLSSRVKLFIWHISNGLKSPFPNLCALSCSGTPFDRTFKAFKNADSGLSCCFQSYPICQGIVQSI